MFWPKKSWSSPKLLRSVLRNSLEWNPKGTPAFSALCGTWVNIHSLVPLLRLRCTVSLSSVFEPVADLCGGQPRRLSQLPLLPRGRVRVVGIPLPQYAPALLFEAVAGLFAVPDRPGKRELSSDTVLSHRPKRAAPELLCFDVVRLEPQLLQFWVVVRWELMAFEYFVELPEVTSMKGNYCLCF